MAQPQAISLEQFKTALAEALRGIQLQPPAVNIPPQQAPIVNIPPPQIQPLSELRYPVVNVEAPDLTPIIKQLENLRGNMPRQPTMQAINENLKELKKMTGVNQDRVIKASKDLKQDQPVSSEDIQNIVDELLEVNGAIENLEETIEEGFEKVESGLIDIKNTNQLSYYIQDPEFFNPPAAPGLPRTLKTKDEIIDVLTKRGLIAFENEIERAKYLNMSPEELQTLGAVRTQIKDQSEDVYNYKNGIDYFTDKGFRRAGFDMLIKDGATTKKGVPLNKEYKFRYSNIEPISINFQNGMYVATQGNKVFKAKNFRDAERFALKGGYQADELELLRKVEKTYYKTEQPLNVIFKARKW